MKLPLNVYVVNDDNEIVVATISALAEEPEWGYCLVGASSGGDKIAELCKEEKIDILVAGWCLGEHDGINIITRAKELRPELRAVLMTGYPSVDVTARALLAGADAILFKPFTGNELRDSLRAAISGQCVLCPAAARYMIDLLRGISLLGIDPPGEVLSPREIQLMKMLSDGKTLKEAAFLLGISEGTAATYRKRVFTKFKAHKLQEALTKWRGGEMICLNMKCLFQVGKMGKPQALLSGDGFSVFHQYLSFGRFKELRASPVVVSLKGDMTDY